MRMVSALSESHPSILINTTTKARGLSPLSLTTRIECFANKSHTNLKVSDILCLHFHDNRFLKLHFGKLDEIGIWNSLSPCKRNSSIH